ncbi:MAG: tRNA (N(6)-L-threonylcarbamoyladenosine(37)-C(2))-methylthiotransferase MtaB [Candidatus Omnitrophica bacterium]|nr:tRNA (N(6)-L-threonylcarbamoyladenosine(37)-C(2))-methylthiotransferase MtaB [Candidatus Omnitrophota bacterium]MBU1996896.1 tRNA (N(6)-L-threonylcarbamoyladenosine(37)-C(2))-methylthiotransferase MtaB [Candidatus Omnitrophota bacterium]MBU4333385.1 tRNA (N(6)-L-threonylcarbamoyladenosine(37)-C(2))-methylthiotransferase MtaB [Candidatus Omnitrophota bacterium]
MIKKTNTISFYTLGCRLNQSETAVLIRSFEENSKFHVLPSNTAADVAVINTCTVTEKGDADTRKLINKINRLNSKTYIALIGCQSQIQKEELLKLPNVKLIVGNANKMDLSSIINDLNNNSETTINTPDIPRTPFKIAYAGIDKNHTRANIKIQDGCDFFCSYCEVPYARGRARSREFDDIIKEAKILSSSGHKEIVITGINVGLYKFKNYQLIDVVSALEQVQKIKRIRISSIELTTIPKDLLSKMYANSKVCRFLHIPLQSGSDDILKAMNRKYTFEQFNRFVCEAHNKVSDICIGTDIIVGFPGETEKHFNETFKNIENSSVDHFHVFSYSERRMAKSKFLKNNVKPEAIKKRSELLRDLAQKKSKNFKRSLLGKNMSVLIEQKKTDFWTGLTDNYVRVEISSSKDLTNQIVNVNLKEFKSQHMAGIII